MTKICTTCPYCGVGCGIKAEITGDREVIIKGDEEHPANFGRLCSKGTHLAETVSLEGRLLYPEIGGERVEWANALDLVAKRLADTVREHGPDSVAFYVSGQLLTEDYYVANKLMKGFIGSANIDTNSRLCMASAVAAHVRAFGEDVVPCSYDDLEAADLILLVGSNTAWCHPVIWQRIEKARSERGTKLVVIDPRRTETAECADLHLPIALDGDVVLFNALLAEMMTRGLLDEDYLRDHVDTPAGFWNRLTDDPAAAGIDRGLFDKLADLVAPTRAMPLLICTLLLAGLASPAWGHFRSPASPTPWAGARLAGFLRCWRRIWAFPTPNAKPYNYIGTARPLHDNPAARLSTCFAMCMMEKSRRSG